MPKKQNKLQKMGQANLPVAGVVVLRGKRARSQKVRGAVPLRGSFRKDNAELSVGLL